MTTTDPGAPQEVPPPLDDPGPASPPQELPGRGPEEIPADDRPGSEPDVEPAIDEPSAI